MLRANIYQKNIPSNGYKEIVELVSSFNHQLVEITSKEFSLKNDQGKLKKYSIDYFEKDMFTTTHVGKFENGIPFRLIQPIGSSLEMVKSKFNAKGAFSIGSLNADGFAIHFILTDSNDIRNLSVTEKGDSEQIQRLIDGSLMALQAGLQDKFIEFSKRLLQKVESNPSTLKKLRGGEEISQIMKDNPQCYSFNEQSIINRI